MKIPPEWTCYAHVDLTCEQKKIFLQFCDLLDIKCECDQVSETDYYPFCSLCKNIIFSGANPFIFIPHPDIPGLFMQRFIKELLTSERFQEIIHIMQE